MILIRGNGRGRDDRSKKGRLYHRKMEGSHRRGEGFSRWIYDSFGGVRISRGQSHDFFKKSHRTRGRGGLNFYYGSGLRLAPFFQKSDASCPFSRGRRRESTAGMVTTPPRRGKWSVINAWIRVGSSVIESV